MATEEYQEAKKEQDKEISRMQQHLEDHKPLFRTAIEYGLMFSHKKHEGYRDKDRSYKVGYACGFHTVNCVYLDLYLGAEDSIIKDVGPVIEEMKEHPRYTFDRNTDYLEMGWTGWIFKYNDTDAELLVRAWFENSTKCELVGTGEFKEVMKMECEE